MLTTANCYTQVSYVCCLPAVVLLVAMLLMPESPAQLARAGTSDQAAAALAWLRDTAPEQARSPGGHMLGPPVTMITQERCGGHGCCCCGRGHRG